MLLKNQKMDEVNPENINIIKKIIDDFEHPSGRSVKHRRRCKSCKISQSDSLIHRYRRCEKSDLYFLVLKKITIPSTISYFHLK